MRGDKGLGVSRFRNAAKLSSTFRSGALPGSSSNTCPLLFSILKNNSESHSVVAKKIVSRCFLFLFSIAWPNKFLISLSKSSWFQSWIRLTWPSLLVVSMLPDQKELKYSQISGWISVSRALDSPVKSTDGFWIIGLHSPSLFWQGESQSGSRGRRKNLVFVSEIASLKILSKAILTLRFRLSIPLSEASLWWSPQHWNHF